MVPVASSVARYGARDEDERFIQLEALYQLSELKVISYICYHEN